MLNSVMYQTDGAEGERCGSLASSGLPVVVSFPLTTQLLLASLSFAYNPTRARALSAAASLNESAARAFELGGASLRKESDEDGETAAFFLLSLPTRMTSRGEESGKRMSCNCC